MLSTSAPTGTTLALLIWKSTGIAFSSSVFVQPPAPKLFGPPIMISPQPSSSVLRTSILICSSEKLLTLAASSPLERGTSARMIVSYRCSSGSDVNSRLLG